METPKSTLTISTSSPVVRHLHAPRLLVFGVTLDGTIVVASGSDVIFEGSENELHDVLVSYARDVEAGERHAGGGS